MCTVWSIFGHQYSLVFYHNLYSLPYIWPSVQSGLLSQSVQFAQFFAISTVWSSITICTVWPIFGYQYSLVFYHNLYSLAYIWPSVQSCLLSQSVQSGLYLAISTVWSSITSFTVWSIFGHQYNQVFYHNLYSLVYIWPSVQSGLLSQSVQSGLYLVISTVWSSITICTVCPIFGHQYSLVFYHNLVYIWPSVQSGLLSQSAQSVLYLVISTVGSSITICTVWSIFGHQYSLVFYHNLHSLSYIWSSVQSGLLSQSGLYLAISTVWSSITICTVCPIFGHQYSLVFYHNLVYIWPSVQSGLLSQSAQSVLYLVISTVWSSITIWSIFGHQYSLVFYHNLYSLPHIWPSVQSGLLSQSVQSVLYLVISTVWSSITICTVCPIFGHQYSLVFYHNLVYIWPSVQSGLLSQSVQSATYLAISTVWSSTHRV